MQILKTIEARLVPSEWFPPSKKNPEAIAVASEAARQFTLQLSIASTQLCKELNDRVGQHSDFETWKQEQSIPAETLKSLWNAARGHSPYQEMPERFTRSAWFKIQNIYAGWFKTQAKLLNRWNGLNRWLDMAESDDQLVEISGYKLEEIQARANQIVSEAKARLKQAKPPTDKDAKSKKAQKHPQPAKDQETSTDDQTPEGSNEGSGADRSLANELFETYFSLLQADSSLFDRCAIVHLLKNNCKIATKPENPTVFAANYRKKQKQAQRAEKQLAARLPQVRDLGDEAMKALSDGIQVVTLDNAEFTVQLANLQRKSNPVPYPVLLYSSDDVEWHLIKRKNPTTQKIEERIFVKLRGCKSYLRKQLKKLDLKQNDLRKEYIFEVCCDRRQLQTFQIFLKDWQIYVSDRNKYPITLFAFRSAALIWRQSTENGISTLQPYLKCTVDHKRLSAEGAELVRAEEIAKVHQKLANYEAKQQGGEELTEDQHKDLKKTKSQLAALNHPYPRPSKPPYRGNLNIIVGVSFSREQLATVAVVDCSTQKVLAYRSLRQLLGGEYEKLSAYRLEQGRNANERHQQQKRGKVSTLAESNQGQHLDRLIAKAIVEVVQEFKASSLALPDLTGLRESLQSELEAKAEWKHPGDRAKQDEYKKQYKINLHRWSYGRLTQCIEERAGKVGVPIEQRQQFTKGDFKDKARQIACSAYRAREDVGT
jgi:hypothetical protein